MSCKILSVGKYLPEKILTNSEIEKFADTTDKWVFDNLGIKERRIAKTNECSSDLAYMASLEALSKAKVDANEIDLIVVCTSTPDRISPSTACILQEKLSAKKSAAFDINAVCSGFLYGLSICNAFFKSGIYKKILLVSSETYSKITDWDSRQCVFFGDGAAAVVLEKCEEGFLEVDLYADGTGKENFTVPAGGSYMPATFETVNAKKHFFSMNGREVFKTATKVLPIAINNILKKHNIKIDDVKLMIPHQPSVNILKKIAEEINLPFEKVVTCMDLYANTAGASVPIALSKALDYKQIQKNDIILFMAVGSGWTWGVSLMKWV